MVLFSLLSAVRGRSFNRRMLRNVDFSYESRPKMSTIPDCAANISNKKDKNQNVSRQICRTFHGESNGTILVVVGCQGAELIEGVGLKS